MHYIGIHIVYRRVNKTVGNGMNEYAARIKEVRDQAKMSQGDMAFEIGMSPSGFANIDAGRRNASVDQLKMINNAVRPIIGDRLIYLITGSKNEQYLADHPIGSNYIDRAENLEALESWLVDMKVKGIIRFKGGVSELALLYGKAIKNNANTSHKNAKQA